jgi:4-amino-4-deoxy-L-arabinose transferase-like glycosyltransferase
MKSIDSFYDRLKRIFSNKVLLFFFLGFAIRLFGFFNVYIINPDGVQYIHQARAIYYGQWESLTTCTVNYISNYPLLIVGAYTIFKDWIIAGRFVSFFFGFAALIPLYFLMKRFFNNTISAFCVLIFSFIPVFVSRSSDVLRDPVCWFFLILGLFLFVIQIENKEFCVKKIINKNHLILIASNLSFLMATWARIEAILCIAVSALFIMIVKQEKRIHRLFVFLLPIIFLLLIMICAAYIYNLPVNDYHRFNEFLSKFSGPIDQYQNLRENLKFMANQNQKTVLGEFLQNARSLIWFIVLGVLLVRSLEAFFYPFFLVFFIGMIGSWKKIKSDIRIRYMFVLSISGLTLLYIHILHTWYLAYRFMAIVIIPCSIFAGFGLEKTISFLKQKFKLKESKALLIICLFILVFGISKNMKPREKDKLIYKKVGEMIAEREDACRVTIVGAVPSTVHEWISFYANLKYQGTSCSRDGGIVPENYEALVHYLKENGIRYFLWEEKRWPIEMFDFIHTKYDKDFKELGRWHHRDTGVLIFFKVT